MLPAGEASAPCDAGGWARAAVIYRYGNHLNKQCGLLLYIRNPYMSESIHFRRRRSGSYTPKSNDVRAVQGSVDAAQAYTAVPLREAEDFRPSTSTPTLASHSFDRYRDDQTSRSKEAQKTKNSTATLKQSAYQRWFSTPLDVIISLVPMLFLS